MKKNIMIAILSFGIIVTLLWADGAENRLSSKVRDKPEVNVFLPYGYCGEFVVFWGENVQPVNEPPFHLSYNYYPRHQNAVLIHLPEPYSRANLRFIYAEDKGSVRRNPIFRRTSVTGIFVDNMKTTKLNQNKNEVSDRKTEIDVDIFVINKNCILKYLNHEEGQNLMYYNLNEIFTELMEQNE